MSRLNGRNRPKVYKILVERDGERCFICQKPGNLNTLEIDHLNGNVKDWREQNIHLLCEKCNKDKRKWGCVIISPMSVSVREGVLNNVETSEEIRFISAEGKKSEVYKPKVRNYIYKELMIHGKRLEMKGGVNLWVL